MVIANVRRVWLLSRLGVDPSLVRAEGTSKGVIGSALHHGVAPQHVWLTGLSHGVGKERLAEWWFHLPYQRHVGADPIGTHQAHQAHQGGPAGRSGYFLVSERLPGLFEAGEPVKT